MPPLNEFYYWFGLNAEIFRMVNHIRGGETYDMMMALISRLADAHNMPYYMVALAAWAVLRFIVGKVRSDGMANRRFARWIGVLAVLAASFAIDHVVVHHIKEELAFPRPYIALGSDVHVSGYKEMHDYDDDYASFPSGHASAITILVVGLSPILTEGMAWLGAWLIVLVCWSRMALGMHFPADLLAGVLLSVFITVVARSIIYSILHALRIRC